MVCDSGNKRIQVFKLNGTFVGKFGTEGSDTFTSPWSVAVLSNGRIVVSDVGCDCIKMFQWDTTLSSLCSSLIICSFRELCLGTQIITMCAQTYNEGNIFC